MSSPNAVVAALALAAALAATPPIQAQERSHAITFTARGGGFSTLADLNSAGTADTKTGYALGGGVDVELQRYVALRGDFTYARDQLRANGVATGTHFNRYYYGAAVQLQYPTAGGVTPYLFAGGGALTIKEAGGTGPSKTKGAGEFGLGLRYRIPRSDFAISAEGTVWVYRLRGASGTLTGVDKTQFDVAYTAGVSYRLPF